MGAETRRGGNGEKSEGAEEGGREEAEPTILLLPPTWKGGRERFKKKRQ